MNKKSPKTGNLKEPAKTYEDILKIEYSETGESEKWLEVCVNDKNDARISYSRDINNCKLGYIYGVKSILDIFTGASEKNELVANILKDIIQKRVGRAIVYVTVMEEAHMRFIKKHFKCYFINKIPFGDDTGVQFHIGIVNEKRINESTSLSTSMNEESVESIYTYKEKDQFKCTNTYDLDELRTRGSGVPRWMEARATQAIQELMIEDDENDEEEVAREDEF